MAVNGLSDQRVSWSATGGVIFENGLYLATQPGTFDVIATSKADPSKTAKTKVYVLAWGAGDEDPFAGIEVWKAMINWKINASGSSTDGT